jgi:hypothetical protein
VLVVFGIFAVFLDFWLDFIVVGGDLGDGAVRQPLLLVRGTPHDLVYVVDV